MPGWAPSEDGVMSCASFGETHLLLGFCACVAANVVAALRVWVCTLLLACGLLALRVALACVLLSALAAFSFALRVLAVRRFVRFPE